VHDSSGWSDCGVNFSDQPPSKQWAALTLRGQPIAEVWFKPEGEPLALVFRIPRSSFQIPGIATRLTPESLLKVVALTPDEVESWRHGDASGSAADGRLSDPTLPLPPPPDDATHLEVHVHLKPPIPAVAHEINPQPAADLAPWRDLEAQWKSVLALEATVDTLRMNMEGVRAQLEGSLRMTLPGNEKANALSADLAEWSKAKNRAHYALPKANEFIHRATWAVGTPERKKLGELFKNPIETHASLPPPEEVLQQMEHLRKDRQVLSAQGVAVSQECRGIIADVQSALRRLQSNAATRASQRKGGMGKTF
jgi:hypothetical protein